MFQFLNIHHVSALSIHLNDHHIVIRYVTLLFFVAASEVVRLHSSSGVVEAIKIWVCNRKTGQNGHRVIPSPLSANHRACTCTPCTPITPCTPSSTSPDLPSSRSRSSFCLRPYIVAGFCCPVGEVRYV